MTALRQRLGEYLALRRALGFKLERAAHLLPDFIDYLEHHQAPTVTTALALQWASKPANASRGWCAERLSVVRAFAEHLSAVDPRTEVPPRDLLPTGSRRASPYIYSEHDVSSLLMAARARLSPLRGETYATMLGLLSVTGMRIGETIALERNDVDWVHGTAQVRFGKFGKSRLLPLHDSTVDVLRRYSDVRDHHVPCPRVSAFFLSSRGTRIIYKNVQFCFSRLVRAVGLQPRSQHCRPRIHDLRHTFAVRTLIRWYLADLDVDALLPRLSTYLGHVDPVSTYWYLSACPELLALAARRADHNHRSDS